MRAVVPEPLTVGDPLVTFEVMKMPDVTGLGAFTGSGQVLTVEHEGEQAAYLHKHFPLDEADARAEVTRPTYALKLLPGCDRRPRICELVRSQISDLTIKGAWSGPARLQLFAHALAPLADLPVLEVLSASHILCDLSLGRPAVVHDYLES